MGIYARLKALIPKQSCILCAELSAFCVCQNCQLTLTNHTHRCRSCAHPLPSSQSSFDFCGQCLRTAKYFDRAYTLYDYQGETAQLIKRFKYDHQFCIGHYFSYQLYDLYQTIIRDNHQYDAIIPMPLNVKRIHQRGYNQVQVLLGMIAKKTAVMIDIHSVCRSKTTRPLSSLKLDERRQEIKGVFSAKPMNYQRVLLVDDVMTTGSSLNELAKTILKAGAVRCDVMTLARATLK